MVMALLITQQQELSAHQVIKWTVVDNIHQTAIVYGGLKRKQDRYSYSNPLQPFYQLFCLYG